MVYHRSLELRSSRLHLRLKRKVYRFRISTVHFARSFEAILDVVQVPEDLARELENNDNAGRGAKWVHMEERYEDTVGRTGARRREAKARQS